MVMISTIIMFAAMVLISVIALIKAPKDADLPMQWGIDGKVGWTAKPKLAVTVVPLVAIPCLAIAPIMAMMMPNIPDGIHMFTALGIGVPLVLIHAGHMYFAIRSVKKAG